MNGGITELNTAEVSNKQGVGMEIIPHMKEKQVSSQVITNHFYRDITHGW